MINQFMLIDDPRNGLYEGRSSSGFSKNDLHKADRKLEAVKIFEINHKQLVYDKEKKKLTVPLHFKEDVELPKKLIGSMATASFSGNDDVDRVDLKYEFKGQKHELHYKKDENGILKKVE